MRCNVMRRASYTDPVLRYAITDSRRFGADFASRRAGLAELARRWAGEGLDYVQLREKDLDAGDLLLLAQDLQGIFGPTGTKLLVNSRADVALAAGAAGVHLTSHQDELTPAQVREVFALASAPRPFVSTSCHSLEDIARACEDAADLVLFSPVFEKRVQDELVSEGSGLKLLQQACKVAGAIPILALGGITPSNMQDCVDAGARGIAGIRVFA